MIYNFFSLSFFTITEVFSVIFYKFLFKNTFKRKCIMTNRLALNFGILRLECCKLIFWEMGNVEIFYLCIKGHVYGEGFKSCLIFQEEKTLSLSVKPVTCTEEKVWIRLSRSSRRSLTEVKVEGEAEYNSVGICSFCRHFLKYCNELCWNNTLRSLCVHRSSYIPE